MTKLIKKIVLFAALATGFTAASLMPISVLSAEPQAYDQLSAEWWQWVLSIPVDENPLLEGTGKSCMVGQRGSDWFLVGTFSGGPVGHIERDCSIPEGVMLFFPVVNSVYFNSPNICGQGPASYSAKWMRDQIAPAIDDAQNLSVMLDGKQVKQLHRTKSKVFAVALPEDNLFVDLCAGDSPPGIFSPAVDDGIYVRLNPLSVGAHELNIHGELYGGGFVLDVTYHLMVVPVATK